MVYVKGTACAKALKQENMGQKEEVAEKRVQGRRHREAERQVRRDTCCVGGGESGSVAAEG